MTKDDSTGSPHSVLDVRKKKLILKPVQSMPKTCKSFKRPTFNNAAFFEEKMFLAGAS